MGLDMYLYAEIYQSVKFNKNAEDCAGDATLKHLEYDGKYTYAGGGVRIQIPIAYWRKANAIHKYFVDINKKRNKDEFLGGWFSFVGQEGYESNKELFDRIINRMSDDCSPIYLEREDLEKLLAICEEITAPNEDTSELIKYWTIERVKELLPTQGGFFFGSTDYDEWYFDDIKNTVKKIKKVLTDFDEKSHVDFYYRASW
jgi:hypothetical protein